MLAFSIGDEWKSDVKDIKSYAICILSAAMTLREKYTMFPCIALLAGTIDTFDFSATQDTKLRMFMIGHAQTKKTLCKVNASDCRLTTTATGQHNHQETDDECHECAEVDL